MCKYVYKTEEYLLTTKYKLMNNKICMYYSTKVYKYDLPEYMELLVNGQLKEILDFYLSQENLSYIIKYTTKVYLLSK